MVDNVMNQVPFHPNWKTEIDEISTGVYRVSGESDTGQHFSAEGTRVEELILMYEEFLSRLDNLKSKST